MPVELRISADSAIRALCARRDGRFDNRLGYNLYPIPLLARIPQTIEDEANRRLDVLSTVIRAMSAQALSRAQSCGLAYTFEQRDDLRNPGLHQYRASCDCGWIGSWRNYFADAEKDANAHTSGRVANRVS
jgi:hypothetical protein